MAVSGGAAAGAAAAQIFGSLINTAFNSNSAKKAAAASYAYNYNLMNHQYDLSRALNRNAYQDTTYSMREAGINPMLAINMGINGLSAASGGNVSQQAAQSDLDLASALQLKNDTNRVKNETNKTESDIELNRSTSDQQRANTQSIQEQTKAQAISNKYAEEKSQEEIKLLKAQQQNQIDQGNSAKVMAANNTAMTNSNIATNLETANTAKQTAIQLQRNNEWYEKHPNWYNFSQAASAVGNVFRGGITGKVGK